MFKRFKQYVIKKLTNEQGGWFLPALVSGLAAGAGSAGVSGLMSLFGGGGDDSEIPPQLMNMLNNQNTLSDLGVDWAKYYYPNMKDTSNLAFPAIQNQISGKGMDPQLENQVWALARERLGKGYDNLSNQLGVIGASRGTLNSGNVMQNWMNQVGTARAGDERQLAIERALQNYNQIQQGLQNYQGLLGQMGTTQMGNSQFNPSSLLPYTTAQFQATDYSGLGSLFAKGLSGISGMFGSGTKTFAAPMGYQAPSIPAPYGYKGGITIPGVGSF